MLACLENVVGITKSTCECIVKGLDNTQRANLAVTKSGLLLDDLPGGIHLKSLHDVDACRKMYNITLSARDNAIKFIEDDIVLSLNSKYSKARKNFEGNIGRMSYAQSLTPVKNIQGMRLRPKDYSDGFIKINRMYLILNKVGNFTIRILRSFIDNSYAEVVHTLPVTTQVNAFSSVLLPADGIILPLSHQNEAVEYYVVYDITDGGVLDVKPKDTDFYCGGCNGGRAAYDEYITAVGVELDSIANVQDKKIDNYSHGVILDAEIRCDATKLICREYNADDSVAVVLSYLTWYKAGELLIAEVLRSPDINRMTTIDTGQLVDAMKSFNEAYRMRMEYLSSSMDVNSSNCYVCRPTVNQPTYNPILV